MDLFRFYCRLTNDPVVLPEGTEAHHLISVLRLKKGQQVQLFDGAGRLALAQIAEIRGKTVELRIEELKTTPPRTAGRIIIAASIAKADRFDWLIAKCTELGVDRICPCIFEHTVKQAHNPKIIARWQNIAVSSAKQSEGLFLPVIDGPAVFAEITKRLRADYPKGIFLYGDFSPQAGSLAGLQTCGADIVAFVGPEGGFTEQEKLFFGDNNIQPARLTDTVLRIETAAIAFAAILASRRDAKRQAAT